MPDPINRPVPPPAGGGVTTGQMNTAIAVETSRATAAEAAIAVNVRITKTARIDVGIIASATPSLVLTYNWPTAFADNNYTLTYSVTILSTPPASAATEYIGVGSIQLLAAGAGFNFTVVNQSSLPLHAIVNFTAVHD